MQASSEPYLSTAETSSGPAHSRPLRHGTVWRDSWKRASREGHHQLYPVSAGAYPYAHLLDRPSLGRGPPVQAMIEVLCKEDYPVQKADLVHLSPAYFEHINRYGKYHFAVLMPWSVESRMDCRYWSRPAPCDSWSSPRADPPC
jgi:hypothetical protein